MALLTGRVAADAAPSRPGTGVATIPGLDLYLTLRHQARIGEPRPEGSVLTTVAEVVEFASLLPAARVCRA